MFKTGFKWIIRFSLPFAAVGAWMAVWLGCDLVVYWRMRSWPEVPAKILRAELKADNSGESTTYKATATYQYEYQGRRYTGTRVGIDGGSDNVGSYQRDAYRQLSQYQKSGCPFRCFVDPARPADAILYRDLRLGDDPVQADVPAGIRRGRFRPPRLRPLQPFGGASNAALAAAHPDAPWLWKQDWAAGKIMASSKTLVVASLTAAIVANLATIPTWLVLPGQLLGKHNRIALLGLAPPVIGLGLACWAIVALMRWRKFGQSEFRMASVPGVIGGQLAGAIVTSAKIRPGDGFHLALKCIERTITRGGDGNTVREEIVWQRQQVVAHELLRDNADQSAIPVQFQIPCDCRPTGGEKPDDQIIWRLEATAAVPGLDYRAKFDVPVFITPESDAKFAPEDRDSADYTAADEPDQDLRQARVQTVRSLTGEGESFVFPMARNRGLAVSITLFFLGWSTAIYFIIHFGAPIVFAIVFSLLERCHRVDRLRPVVLSQHGSTRRRGVSA